MLDYRKIITWPKEPLKSSIVAIGIPPVITGIKMQVVKDKESDNFADHITTINPADSIFH